MHDILFLVIKKDRMNLQKPKDNFVEEYRSEARALPKQDLHTLLDLGKG